LDSSPFVKPGRNCSWPNIYIYSGPTFPYPLSPTKPPAHLFIFHIFMIFIFGAGILFAPAAQIFALRILLRVFDVIIDDDDDDDDVAVTTVRLPLKLTHSHPWPG